jgi:predicted Zn finger-like uncharacterized protein
MRLGCPNCGALYEVADAAIPAVGREVQCSACSHRWFHHPHGREPEPVGSPADPQARERAGEADPASAGRAPDAVPAESGPAAHPAARPRPTDPAVLQILREEAAREMAARRREAAQAGAPDPAPVRSESAAAAGAPRRALLPEIDEADPSARTAEAQGRSTTIIHYTPESPARGGFAAGLALSLALAVLATAAYIWSSELAAAVPALEDPLARFAAAVDELRVSIRSATR